MLVEDREKLKSVETLCLRVGQEQVGDPPVTTTRICYQPPRLLAVDRCAQEAVGGPKETRPTPPVGIDIKLGQ